MSLSGSAGFSQSGREPSKPIRPYSVTSAQKLDEIEKKLSSGNNVEDLVGGAGMELRVAVQHEANKPAGAAEVHDKSDDVYYVLEGTATLTLGGRLEGAKETESGEWRAIGIVGGQNFEIKKGDLVIVPRGTPHQRSTVGKTFSMILIKVFADPLSPPVK